MIRRIHRVTSKAEQIKWMQDDLDEAIRSLRLRQLEVEIAEVTLAQKKIHVEEFQYEVDICRERLAKASIVKAKRKGTSKK